MPARITFDTEYSAGDIDPRIFSGFLEHLGRAVYGGVYDPGNRRSDVRGFRTDVLDALGRLNLMYVRYPGGNFVSNYDWKDGIGPVDSRPVRADFAWQSLEPNTFGTDEFMDWCSSLGVEPMLAVNLGTGSPRAAAELVEYCNMARGTYWSDLRTSNGHRAPHGVRLWCLGNEMDGPWQAGHSTAQEYAQRAAQAGKLMKGIDPDIETVVAGSSNANMPTYMEWDRQILEQTWDAVDYISAHRYSRKHVDDTAWFLADGLEVEQMLQDYRGLLSYMRAVKKSSKSVALSFDEWNVWYKAMAPEHKQGGWNTAPCLLEEVYNLEDALVCAQYLNAFIRNADIVKIACVAQLVNVIAPILTSESGLLIQSIYWPLAQYSRHARSGSALSPNVDSPTYHAGERGDVPALDVSAAYDPGSGSLSVFIVNRDPENETETLVGVNDRAVDAVQEATVMTADDPLAHNDWSSPNALAPRPLPASRTDEGKASLTMPPMSYAVVRLTTARR